MKQQQLPDKMWTEGQKQMEIPGQVKAQLVKWNGYIDGGWTSSGTAESTGLAYHAIGWLANGVIEVKYVKELLKSQPGLVRRGQ